MNTLALLIDADNISLKHTQAIIQFCKQRGTLKIIRAYGDWKQLPLLPQSTKLTQLGVELVQQNRIAPNATDFKLAMDTAVMLHTSLVDVYFLVSSDGHFTTVFDTIRQTGVKGICIGRNVENASALRQFSHEYVDIEDILLRA